MATESSWPWDGRIQWSAGVARMVAPVPDMPAFADVRGLALGPGAPVRMSWVTVERLAREQAGPRDAGRSRPYRDDAEALTDEQLLERMRGSGVEVDRAGLEQLCRGALSAEEVASGLMDDQLSVRQWKHPDADWVWLAVLTLWQRWWPDVPCLETVDDQIQEGYALMEQDRSAGTDRWLEAWFGVLHLCNRAGITTIRGFDERFPLSQSLYNWHQDLELELGNVDLAERVKLRARIVIGEEVLRRFTDCQEGVVENWRRAIAESWFWLGESAKTDQLFRGWLDADPQWGMGWVGWAVAYMLRPGGRSPADLERAEELLNQGQAVTGVRDRDMIASWLQLARRESSGRRGRA